MAKSPLGRAAVSTAFQAAVTYIRNNDIEVPNVKKLSAEIELRLRARIHEAQKDAVEAEKLGYRGLAAKQFFVACAEAGVDAAREVTNTTFGLPGGDR